VSPDAVDRAHLAQALALAALGEGRTRPNPCVGAVLVRGGRVVGSGHHAAAGLPHAEAIAIQAAGARAAGATLYVNLEPCAHHGRTPPCADLLVESRVKRVVASIQDPNPWVNGKGFERLVRAGIEVDTGLLAVKARRLNEAFLHWHETGRPLVTLKAAATLDGRIAVPRGMTRWISGPAARRCAHRLRLCSDAILVGAGTVRSDDPALTVRLDRRAEGRLRVVLSESLDLDPAAKVFAPGPAGAPPTKIFTSFAAPAAPEARLAERARIVRVASASGSLDLHALVQQLGAEGVQSLLVEGGGRTWAAFLAAGLADRLALFLAPRLVGADGAVALVGGESVADLALGARLLDRQLIPLGEDLLLTGRVLSAAV
jgi:diaminohydroxyphosphoribosylaminopyrimidine deaminase/5-amino-6-(5-phosphoribosylamino)uracil reductase